MLPGVAAGPPAVFLESIVFTFPCLKRILAMSTSLLEEPAVQAATGSATSHAERLRTSMMAMRLSFTWFGTRKTLSADQKDQAAESFGAEGSFLSAGKKLIDVKHPAFKAVSSIKNKAVRYFREVSLPYPEAGIRLIRPDRLDEVNRQMEAFRSDLGDAVYHLARAYAHLKALARERLGTLYNEGDYPPALSGLFGISWEFPSVEAPDYLQQLNPEVYRQECQRVQQRFSEAVQLAEQAFTEELAKLVSHLTERLSGTENGERKVFRDGVIENLTEFFDRFRQLNIGSSEQLDGLVNDARRIIRGVRPQALRDDTNLRQHVATEMSRVQSVLDGLLINQPRRNILRRPR